MREDLPILIAEDDEDDVTLLHAAIRRAGMNNPIRFVPNGYEAVEYLMGHGDYADRRKYPFPRIIITDLKMPRLTGLELLDWLHRHPKCAVIPTVLLSGSAVRDDIENAFHLGVNSYFQKPTTLDELTALMHLLHEYWSKSEVPLITRNC